MISAPARTEWLGPPLRRGAPAAILLPGRDQPAEFMMELFHQLSLPLSCVVLTNENNSWYPGRVMEPHANDQSHLNQAIERIESLVTTLERSGISRDRVGIVGFSQGACVACEYMFRHPGRWGALIALTGGLFGPAERTGRTESGALESTPVLLTNSDEDPWVPLTWTRQTAEAFRRCGAIVTERIYAGRAHEISRHEVDAVRDLLRTL